MEFISNSSEQTKKFAEKLAKKLKPGAVIALFGELGAGKTTFIQGLAKGLGFPGRVLSPTFIFVRPYKLNNKTIKTLNHIDMYRLETTADLKTIGIEEFLNDKQAVSAIEWPERIENLLPADTIKIKIEEIENDKRKITIDG